MNEQLTQVPVPGLDGISRTDLEREWRGAIHVARLRLQQVKRDPDAIRRARHHLAQLLWDARRERIRPFSHT